MFSHTQVCGRPRLNAREPADRTVLPEAVGLRRFVDAFGQPVQRIDVADVLRPRDLRIGYRATPLGIDSSGTVQQRFTRSASPDIAVDQLFRNADSVDLRWTIGGWHVLVSVSGSSALAQSTALRVARSMP